MKLGIKKLHANEWQLHIDSAFIHLDRYSLELLYSNLDHLLSMDSGQKSSVLTGLIKLIKKFLELSDAHMQLFLRDIDSQDLLNLLKVNKNDDIKNKVFNNVGGIMSKQLLTDINSTAKPNEDDAVESIKHIIRTMFELETTGKIEFVNEQQKFI